MGKSLGFFSSSLIFLGKAVSFSLSFLAVIVLFAYVLSALRGEIHILWLVLFSGLLYVFVNNIFRSKAIFLLFELFAFFLLVLNVGFSLRMVSYYENEFIGNGTFIEILSRSNGEYFNIFQVHFFDNLILYALALLVSCVFYYLRFYLPNQRV